MYKFLLFLFLGFSCVNANELDDLFKMSLEDLLDIEVTTTSKYAEKIYDSPANIHVLTKEMIEQRGYQNVADILRSLPGVDLQEYDIVAIFNTFTFRGSMDNNKFLILKDGVRISSPANEITAVSYNFPVYYAKRVEVLMGPASVVYGADAFAGVVNIITMDEDNEDSIEVQLTAGTDDYGYGYANLNQHFQNGMHLNLGIQGYTGQDLQLDKDYPELYTDSSTDYNFQKTKQWHTYGDLELNDNIEVGFNHSSIKYSNDYTATTALFGTPNNNFSTFSGNPFTQESITNIYTKLKVNVNSKLRSSTLLNYMHYELDNQSNFENFFTSYQQEYKYAKSQRYSFNQDFTYELNDEHLLSAGFVYDYFDIIPRGPDLPSPYDTNQGPNSQNLNYDNTTLAIEFNEQSYEGGGLYIQDNWKLNDAWRLVTGIRYDHSSFYGDTTNPRISTIYKHNEQNIFKLMYGHSFLAPAPNQAFTSFGGFPATQADPANPISSPFAPFRVPNPELKPERLKTLEFNYEYWYNPQTHLKLAPFYTRISDVIVVGDAGGNDTSSIPGATLLSTTSFQNAGSSKIYGVDISGEHNAEYPNLTFKNWLAFSYIDGYLEENGIKTDLPMLSHYKLKGGSTIIYKEDYLISPMFRWISGAHANEISATDPSTRDKVPSYFVMDMHAEAKITKSFSLKADIINLFDKQYGHAPFPSSFFAFEQAPQPGRLITGSLYLKF